MPYFGPGFGLGGKSNKMLIDGDIVLTNNSVSATPATNGSGGGQTSTTYVGKKPAVAISVPGNIITEEVAGSEGLIVEELFEDLSLFELMELGRSDSVLGLNITYQPIKNISDIYFTYSPKKILALSGTFGDSDESSALKLGQYSVDGAMSIDPLTGDLLVAVDNVKDGFVVQVEIVSGGEIQDS
jgi:hypothetical protein